MSHSNGENVMVLKLDFDRTLLQLCHYLALKCHLMTLMGKNVNIVHDTVNFQHAAVSRQLSTKF